MRLALRLLLAHKHHHCGLGEEARERHRQTRHWTRCGSIRAPQHSPCEVARQCRLVAQHCCWQPCRGIQRKNSEALRRQLRMRGPKPSEMRMVTGLRRSADSSTSRGEERLQIF